MWTVEDTIQPLFKTTASKHFLAQSTVFSPALQWVRGWLGAFGADHTALAAVLLAAAGVAAVGGVAFALHAIRHPHALAEIRELDWERVQATGRKVAPLPSKVDLTTGTSIARLRSMPQLD